MASTIGQEACEDSFDSLVDKARRLMNEPAFLASERDRAARRAESVIGVSALVDRMLGYFDDRRRGLMQA